MPKGAQPVPGGGSSCVQLCIHPLLRGPWVFVGSRGVSSCQRAHTGTMKTKATLGIYLYPLLAPGEEKSAAANGQCVTDQGGCQSRLWKSDFLLHFSAGEKVTTSPFRIVSLTLCAGCSDAGRWEGKEPGPQHPLAQNHEEMLNWHLELSVMAGLGGQTLLHPVWITQSFL